MKIKAIGAINIFLLLSFTNFLWSCKAQKNFHRIESSGAVVVKTRIKRVSEDNYRPMKYDRDEKLLFKDSFFIEERTAIDINTDTSGKESWKA